MEATETNLGSARRYSRDTIKWVDLTAAKFQENVPTIDSGLPKQLPGLDLVRLSDTADATPQHSQRLPLLVKTSHVHSHVRTSVPHTINSMKIHVISLPVKAEGSNRAGIAEG